MFRKLIQRGNLKFVAGVSVGVGISHLSQRYRAESIIRVEDFKSSYFIKPLSNESQEIAPTVPETFIPASAPPKDNSPAVPMTRYTIADVAEKCLPAVVNVKVAAGGHEKIASGSGFLIKEEGKIYVLTNAHIVNPKIRPLVGSFRLDSLRFEIMLLDGRKYDVKVHGVDNDSDIALLEILDRDDTPLPLLTLGRSRLLRPGEWVVALGCPLSFNHSVAAGVVGAVNRTISLTDHHLVTDYIQLDVSIKEGNSGGPLVNLEGHVVGINSFQAANITAIPSAIGFAIPIDYAKRVVKHLALYREVRRAFVGVGTEPLDELQRKNINKFHRINHGIHVSKVVPKSPADKAGFVPGDVLIDIDGLPIKNFFDLQECLAWEVGKEHTATVIRGSQKKQLQVIPVQPRS